MEKNIETFEEKNNETFEILKSLSKFGKMSKEVEIGNVKIVIGTLNSEQEGKVFSSCSELVGNSYFNKLKRETLKFAIKSVNGKRLDEYEDLKDEEQSEKIKKETLEKLEKTLGTFDEEIISYLYSKWNELTKESENKLKELGIEIK